MAFIDKFNGYNRKLTEAQKLYTQGKYSEAIRALGNVSRVQCWIMSEDQYCMSELIAARCFNKLGAMEVAINCLNRIIDYPGYNNKYISQAEALKQDLLEQSKN